MLPELGTYDVLSSFQLSWKGYKLWRYLENANVYGTCGLIPIDIRDCVQEGIISIKATEWGVS